MRTSQLLSALTALLTTAHAARPQGKIILQNVGCPEYMLYQTYINGSASSPEPVATGSVATIDIPTDPSLNVTVDVWPADASDKRKRDLADGFHFMDWTVSTSAEKDDQGVYVNYAFEQGAEDVFGDHGYSWRLGFKNGGDGCSNVEGCGGGRTWAPMSVMFQGCI
jgi:hypothetical protein